MYIYVCMYIYIYIYIYIIKKNRHIVSIKKYVSWFLHDMNSKRDKIFYFL